MSRSHDAAAEEAIWKALANVDRRRILDTLHDGPATTGEVIDAVGTSRHVVLQHLTVLRAAGLVHTVADGRRRINQLNAAPIHQIYEGWVARYEALWTAGQRGPAETPEGPGDAATSAASVKATRTGPNKRKKNPVAPAPKSATVANNAKKPAVSGDATTTIAQKKAAARARPLLLDRRPPNREKQRRLG